jgi:hypothetical protein
VLRAKWQFRVYDLPDASFSYTPTDFLHACDSRDLLLPWMCNERSEKRLGCVESEVVCDSICRDLKPCDLYHGTQVIFIIIVLPTVSYHHTKNVRHASCMGMKYEPPNKEYLYSQKKIDSQKNTKSIYGQVL